jgi:hypothetical protein
MFFRFSVGFFIKINAKFCRLKDEKVFSVGFLQIHLNLVLFFHKQFYTNTFQSKYTLIFFVSDFYDPTLMRVRNFYDPTLMCQEFLWTFFIKI